MQFVPQRGHLPTRPVEQGPGRLGRFVGRVQGFSAEPHRLDPEHGDSDRQPVSGDRAPTRQAEAVTMGLPPGRDAVSVPGFDSSVNPKLTKAAGEVAAWVDYLLHPKSNNGPRVYRSRYG